MDRLKASMPLHTAGPWRRGSDELNSPDCWNEVYAANGYQVATAHMRGAGNSNERGEAVAIARANATLMAAAPDLLEVCRLFIAYQVAIDSDDPATRPLEAYSTAMDAAYAAFAKASA